MMHRGSQNYKLSLKSKIIQLLYEPFTMNKLSLSIELLVTYLVQLIRVQEQMGTNNQ